MHRIFLAFGMIFVGALWSMAADEHAAGAVWMVGAILYGAIVESRN